MNCTGLQGTSALDFYLSMGSRQSPRDCRGPIVYLDLSEQVIDRVTTALLVFGDVSFIQDKVIAPTNTGHVRSGACVAHWLDMSAVVSVVGVNAGRRDLQLVASVVMQDVCRSAGWDYRELSNYLASKASPRRS